MKKPIEFRTKERKLQGFPRMTKFMYEVLTFLAFADDRDEPYEYLDGVRKHTINALVMHGYIVEAMATDLDYARYRITADGKRAYNAYSDPQTRRDGICPVCGVRPKIPGNHRCRSCKNTAQKRARKMKRPQARADRPCSRCGKRKRYVSKSGYVSIYCKHCLTVIQRRLAKKKSRSKMDRIEQGEVILCSRCHEKPVYISGKTVYCYCSGCYALLQRRSRIKRGVQRGELPVF